jgi:hypothetical protein
LLSFGNTKDAFLQKIQTSERRPVESIAIAAQGITAVILYTVQTNEGLKAYQQTINLCPFYDDDEIRQRCYAPAIDKINAETQEIVWEVPTKDAPVFIEKANVLNQGALSLIPINENEFFASLDDATGQKKTYLLTRREESQTFQSEEAPLLPDPRYPLLGVMPLVYRKASGDAYAFYTEDTAQLSFSALDGKYQRRQAPLAGKGALRSYAAALSYRSFKPSQGGLAALWFGPGPVNRGNKQLSFAQLAFTGKLREAPLRVLPGEEISAASMTVLEREEGLRFGVFYQHEDSEVGLGFVQIDCNPE